MKSKPALPLQSSARGPCSSIFVIPSAEAARRRCSFSTGRVRPSMESRLASVGRIHRRSSPCRVGISCLRRVWLVQSLLLWRNSAKPRHRQVRLNSWLCCRCHVRSGFAACERHLCEFDAASVYLHGTADRRHSRQRFVEWTKPSF